MFTKWLTWIFLKRIAFDSPAHFVEKFKKNKYSVFFLLCACHTRLKPKAAELIWKSNFVAPNVNKLIQSGLALFLCCQLVGSMSPALSLSAFSSFSQLLSFPISTWLLIFASLIIAGFAHFLVTSIVLLFHSYNGIKKFHGPRSHWLKGHIHRVSYQSSEIFFYKGELKLNCL